MTRHGVLGLFAALGLAAAGCSVLDPATAPGGPMTGGATEPVIEEPVAPEPVAPVVDAPVVVLPPVVEEPVQEPPAVVEPAAEPQAVVVVAEPVLVPSEPLGRPARQSAAPRPSEPQTLPVVPFDRAPMPQSPEPDFAQAPAGADDFMWQDLTSAEEVLIPRQPDFAPDETHRTVDIYVATNRTLNPTPQDPASVVTDQIGPLRYATASVSIPREHRMGHLESQNWLMAWAFDPNEKKHVILQRVTPMDTEALMALLRADLTGQEDAVLLYVHGFNTSFEKALRRAGQLTYDLVWHGPSMVFSWPSQGAAVDYLVDGTNAANSVPAMIRVLSDLAEQDPGKIIVIAHSMGTRIVSEAIKQLALARDQTVLPEISMVILAAPDIDATTFVEQIAPRFREAAVPVTLYASSEDAALKVSKRANGFPRIGDTTNGVPDIPGVDVVDATGAVSDFFGHTYFGDNTSILSDIHELINTNKPLTERPTVVQVPASTEPERAAYWRINLAR